MKQLTINFDNPEYGWIGISATDGISTATIDFDSKSHSFYDLTTALLGLMEGRGEFTVIWLEKPGTTDWKFVKTDDQIVFEFWEKNLYREPVIRITGSYQEVCFPFWRALQSLAGRFTRTELEERMQDVFPFSELDRLTLKIQALKTQMLD